MELVEGADAVDIVLLKSDGFLLGTDIKGPEVLGAIAVEAIIFNGYSKLFTVIGSFRMENSRMHKYTEG